MELQAILVLCGVGVVGAAVLLLMGLFSASGTSYEEAIAQQRRAASELLALADNKNKSKKTNKKANKKLAKKEKKENVTAATGSEPDSEPPAESGVEDDSVPAKPHVEFCPPVVVELPTDTPPNIKIRKRGKDPKVKPILINKEDPSCISDPSAAPTPITEVSNHFEEMHPKDEFELLHSTLEKVSEKKEEAVEKKENKVVKQAKGGKTATKSAPSVPEAAKEETREKTNNVEAPLEQRKAKKLEKKAPETSSEEVVPPLNAPQPAELTTDKLLRALPAAPAPAPAPSPPAKSKKKKPEQNVLALLAGDGGGVAVGELVRVVREATLSRTEIQILTDALLNKHHDPLPEHSEWTEGPNDPMQKLKKQLAEKEKLLADETEASQALQAKLKELRANLNAERARAAAASRTAEQAAATARAELHTLQTRIQRLVDENHAHAQDKITIQRLSESEAALVAQMGALQAEAGARVVEAGQARCEAAAARDALLLAQQHAADLAQQLQDANRAFAELELQRQNAAHAEKVAQQETQELLLRALDLQKEIQSCYKREKAAQSTADKLKEDLDKQQQELSSEIASLRDQLAARESELAELKQLKAAPAQNGLPPSGLSDEQKAAELSKVESVVESLRGELAAAQHGSREQREQLAALQQQLAAYKDKNNELRTKNWKVMEALQTAERALASRGAPAMPATDEAVSKAQESHFTEVANVLRAVCPSAAPNSNASQEWLQIFADNLKKELEKKEIEKQQVEKDLSTKLLEKDNERKQLESDLKKKLQENELAAKEIENKLQQKVKETEAAKRRFESELQQKLRESESVNKHQAKEVTRAREDTTANSRLQDLEAQNENLQVLVDKYKRIIDDTEGVLSRLQANVSREEQRWAQQLAEAQQDLHVLRTNTVMQMQNKIDTLEAELKKVQSRNHSHSFADAERHTEEKLLSSLSEKHDSDVHNGPLQVDLNKI